MIDEPQYSARRVELLAAWFVRYVDPARDGTHEAVMGRGQLDVVGPVAGGR